MKILKPVSTETLPGSWARADYSPILAKLSTLQRGLALPVECDDNKKAQNLQYWVYQVLNRDSVYDSKWSAVRRKNTVFITRAEHIPNDKRIA
jgi:hypothetical protein